MNGWCGGLVEWTRWRVVDHMVRYDLQPDGRHTSAANVSIVGRDVRNAWATRNDDCSSILTRGAAKGSDCLFGVIRQSRRQTDIASRGRVNAAARAAHVQDDPRAPTGHAAAVTPGAVTANAEIFQISTCRCTSHKGIPKCPCFHL